MPLSGIFPPLPVRAPYPAGTQTQGALMSGLVNIDKDRSTIVRGSAAEPCGADACVGVLMLDGADVRLAEREAKHAAFRG